MNNDILLESMNYFSEELIGEHLRRKERLQRRPSRLLRASAIAAAAVVLLAMLAVAVPALIDRADTSYYPLAELKITELGETASWRTSISVPEDGGVVKSLSSEDIARMFGTSELPYASNIVVGRDDIASSYARYYSSGELHSVILSFLNGNDGFTLAIDSSKAPDFSLIPEDGTLLDAEHSQVLRGCRVGIVRNYTQNGKPDWLVIGMEKDGIGFMISGDPRNESAMEEVFNYILNSDIHIFK